MTRSIQVEARGEVAELKDNINTMIDNLRLTTDRNTEQDWLEDEPGPLYGYVARATRPDHRGPHAVSELAPLVNAQQGVIYQMETEESAGMVLLSAFAEDGADGHLRDLRVGEGLVGQCAAEKRAW